MVAVKEIMYSPRTDWSMLMKLNLGLNLNWPRDALHQETWTELLLICTDAEYQDKIWDDLLFPSRL